MNKIKIKCPAHDFKLSIRKEDIMKKILWYGRSPLTRGQLNPLVKKGENFIIYNITNKISSAYEIADEINECDIIAIDAPSNSNLQAQFLKIADKKPVIMAVNDSVLHPDPSGCRNIVEFHFVKWKDLRRFVKWKDLRKLPENEDYIPQ